MSKIELTGTELKTPGAGAGEGFAAETAAQIERYSKRATNYDLEVMVFDFILGKSMRRDLFEGDYGNLLEAGVGAGGNMEFYPDDVDCHAIDLTPAMLELGARKAEIHARKVKLAQMDVTRLDFPDNYFDRIVASCLFCSVPDPVAGLRELRRVLKPDGEIRMLEHMRPDLPLLGRLFDLVDPFFYKRAGFHIARRTLDNIKKAELTIKTDRPRLVEIFHYLELVKGA